MTVVNAKAIAIIAKIFITVVHSSAAKLYCQSRPRGSVTLVTVWTFCDWVKGG